MKPLKQVKRAIEKETDKIWLNEPPEIKRMRLGVYASDAGSYGQYFSNMVFVNGDMRALSTWVTPSMMLKCLSDDTFTLEQCQKIFAEINLVAVDFLAYCGFTKMGEFVHDIVEAFPEMETKDDLLDLLKVWYAYANRLYLWVHQVFPWGLGTAFLNPKEEDLRFISEGLKDKSVANYFKKYGPGLVEIEEK